MLDKLTEAQKPSKNIEKWRDGPVSRILCGAQTAERLARRGDHSSRPRFAPWLEQPTRGFSVHEWLAPPQKERVHSHER